MRFVLVALPLAGLALWAQLALAAPPQAVLVVWDSRQPRGAQAFKQLVELLKRQRAQGHFVGLDVDPSFRVYDFAVAEHAHSLKALGVGRPAEPLLCLTRVNEQGIPNKLTWQMPVKSAEQAMGALDQRLSGLPSARTQTSSAPVASTSPHPTSTDSSPSPNPNAATGPSSGLTTMNSPSSSPKATTSPSNATASPPSTTEAISGATPATDSLPSGNALLPGMFLESNNRIYRLVCQPDGNCVVYRQQGDRQEQVWDTDTGGRDRRLSLERTGLLQVLGADDRSHWRSSYQGMIGQYRLRLQDDGDLVVEQRKGPEWSFCWSAQRGSEGAWRVPPGMRLDRRR